jgi:hypothetical protein
MRTDIEIKNDAFKILFEKLGSLETERFVSWIQKTNFDYTKWRENLPKYDSIEQLSKDAMDLRKVNKSSHGKEDA